MALRVHKCTNFGYCSTADAGKTFELPDAGNPACPDCSSLTVIPVKSPGRPRTRVAVAGFVAVLLVAAVTGVQRWHGLREAERMRTAAADMRGQLRGWLVDPEPQVARLTALVESGQDPKDAASALVTEIRREADDAARSAELERTVRSLYRTLPVTDADRRLGAILAELEQRSGFRASVFERYAGPLRARQLEVAAAMTQAMEAIRRGELAAAAETFETVAKLDPENPWPYANLCGAYAKLRRSTEASDACDRAARLDPRNWLAHYNRASLEALQGRRESAVAALRHAVKFVELEAAGHMTRPALIAQMRQDPSLALVRNEISVERLTAETDKR